MFLNFIHESRSDYLWNLDILVPEAAYKNKFRLSQKRQNKSHKHLMGNWRCELQFMVSFIRLIKFGLFEVHVALFIQELCHCSIRDLVLYPWKVFNQLLQCHNQQAAFQYCSPLSLASGMSFLIVTFYETDSIQMTPKVALDLIFEIEFSTWFLQLHYFFFTRLFFWSRWTVCRK